MYFLHSHWSSYHTVWIQGDWKIVYHYLREGAERYELFNLAEDPYEATNLAATHPADLKRMMKTLAKELEEAGAGYPKSKGGDVLRPEVP